MSELEPTRTYSNPTANDILRRMLDERGVEWTDGGMFHRTHWVIDGVHHTAFEQDGKLYLQLSIGPLAPEQAIAATLGVGTCHMVLREDIRGHAYQDTYECSECGEYVVRETCMGESEPPNYCPNCGRRCVG